MLANLAKWRSTREGAARWGLCGTMTLFGWSFSVRFALAAWMALTCAAPLSARDLKIGIDPDGSGFTIEGWARQVSGTGTIFYHCQEESCGRGSTVSLRKQPATEYTAEGLRQNEQRVAAVITSQLQGRIARVDISSVKSRNDKVFKISEVSRTIVPLAGADIGMPLYWKSGFVATPKSAYTISSSASTRKLADRNFATFQIPLLIVVKLQSK